MAANVVARGRYVKAEVVRPGPATWRAARRGARGATPGDAMIAEATAKADSGREGLGGGAFLSDLAHDHRW